MSYARFFVRPLRTFCLAISLLSLFVLPGLLTGCGGSGGGGTTVRSTPVRFAIRWGARSRTLVAPSSALSLRLTLRKARPDGSDLTVTVDRTTDLAAYPQDVTTSDLVNVGAWQAVVICYAQPGGTGSVVGTGQATVTIAADGTGIGDIAINGTIASVTLDSGQGVPVNTLADLAFTCRDSSGALVTVSPGSAFFLVTAGTNRLRITNGRAEGILPGTATVEATVDDIASAPAAVQVTSSATVAVTPSPATLFVEGTQTFAAQVTNAPDTSVTWSVQEGTAGGSISASGLYQAPANPGTFHVVATSVYDPAKQAVVPVTVQAVGTRTIYQNAFDGVVGSEWSKTTTETTPVGGRRFLGQFGKEVVTLSLGDLPPHTSVTIAFKLFLIRTWDGNIGINRNGTHVGPDAWSLTLDGASLLQATFSNWEAGSGPEEAPQTYPNAVGAGAFPGRTGASETNTLGFASLSPYPGPVQDTVYDLTFTVPHSAKTATFTFGGQENEAIDNESWGIDSVQVMVSGR